MNLEKYKEPNEVFISPQKKELQYSGRIDFTDPQAPLFIYPSSSITTVFTGTSLKIIISNHHAYWDNYIGYIIDGKQHKVQLPQDQEIVGLTLAENLEDKDHSLILFKRMDACHHFRFYGLLLSETGKVSTPPPKPNRRIEFYGDSVTAGEVSEAVDYVGKSDPEYNGEYSNSWYSYAAITARRLNAEIHNIAQGGIALLDGTGWFAAPYYYGMETVYDKLKYNLELGEKSQWDFDLFTPHVVVVAIGQNDNHPVDYMKEEYEGKEAQRWRKHYKEFVLNLYKKYPKALIILATTILNHDVNWDRSIQEVCKEINHPKIVHFLYSNNGCGTPGHIRIPEAEQMAEELTGFIESFGESIWVNHKVG